MPSGTDFIGAFRAYAQKAMGNDFNAEKAAAALNTWVKESGDALKERIERETEKAVKKLGLAKESDLQALADEVAQLRKALGVTKKTSATKSKKSSKKAAVQSATGARGQKRKKAAVSAAKGRSSTPRKKA